MSRTCGPRDVISLVIPKLGDTSSNYYSPIELYTQHPNSHSDPYHDTQTHYLMEQDSSLLQDQASMMDTIVGDTWTAMKKRGALQGHAQVVWLSVLHV